ncbi:trigger factor [Sphingomonas sp. TX0543]|uniref:trigger factor n=1 Tax=unclassified Sphingomonas TaxID=196159 RepID=UPI0010F69581|nr:trigger factor [Sphingomonas sp. 3P27F8]
MQTVETLNEGLKRAYTLTITAKDIDKKVDAELKRVAPQIRMPGFRPGKVPANLVRKMHGPALLQDALNNSIQEGVQTLIADKQLRPAMQPSVELGEGYEPGKDAEVKVELEVLPQVPTPSIDALKLERLTVPVSDEAVDEQLKKFADQMKRWEDAKATYKAKIGDQVTVDFVGKTLDGVAFEGGTGTDMAIELGEGRLIPGFEDQVVGVKTGDERQIKVTFPNDYPAKELAGQDATFDLTVKSVKTAAESKIDEDLAKNLGLESLEQLKGLLKGQIEQEHNGLTRTYMKRKLLDQLAAGHDFEVPPSMVEAEFAQIWQQLEHEATHEADPKAALEELEGDRDDYRKIAERRVRLGLLLSEIGQANGVDVTQQEMNRLIAQAAQQYRGEDQQRFIQYIQQEPMAAAQLRAPLYEDKVVDFLFEKAEVTDRETTRGELEAAIESDDGFSTGTHTHDHDDHKPRKKPAAKKADTGADAAEKPAKKTPAKKAVVTDESPAAEEKAAKPAAKKAPANKAAPATDEADAKPATKKAPAKKAAAKKEA